MNNTVSSGSALELGSLLAKKLTKTGADQDLVQEAIDNPDHSFWGTVKTTFVVVEDSEPKKTIHNPRQTGGTLADWLRAREELHKFFTGERIVLRNSFALTDEELASTTLMPAFRPALATNQTAVDWKRKMGIPVFVEGEKEGGVMRYKNSQGLGRPELHLINRSVKPDKDTLGKDAKSPDNLLLVPDKLWLGLFGWCDADTLHFAITGEHLDPKTWTWFPEDRLSGGGVAGGYWGGGQAKLCWYFADRCDPHYGARAAKKVPLRT